MPASPDPEAGTPALWRLFVLILLTQVLVTAALFWFGHHFS